MFIYIIVFSILSYLLGSFSSAYWYGKWFFNLDVRNEGSGNAGTTNVLRTFGIVPAIFVFLTDVAKSFISVTLIIFIPNIVYNSEMYFLIKILFGSCAIIGHLFPLYSHFKGGKGVASMLGMILAISPLSASVALSIFIIILLTTKIVSISSISAAVFFPIIIMLNNSEKSLILTIFSFAACILIIVTHRKNIKKLIHKEEKKISFSKKRKENRIK
ncbi:MAG: glycerol-3-phosphate 1-O-acyltransferase PlsY [Bacteroidales bacterium]|jgi:glycerol-3-phosphate acyltransferase PlsY|nr:glycerol-3-phosphate 1-O-acyltransferase PlsY [Bacteroidales bacterium]